MMWFVVRTRNSDPFRIRSSQMIPIVSDQIVPHALISNHFQQLVLPEGENVGRKISFLFVETPRFHSSCVDEERGNRGGERRLRKGANGNVADDDDWRVGGS